MDENYVDYWSLVNKGTNQSVDTPAEYNHKIIELLTSLNEKYEEILRRMDRIPTSKYPPTGGPW